MPVAFLSDEQVQEYGRYTGEASAAQLARFFPLDDAEPALLRQRRSAPHRLGCALQRCPGRFLGTFLVDPTDVPPGLVASLCRQLGMPDSACLPRYLDRPSTPHEHADDITPRYGSQDCHTPAGPCGLVRWL